MTGAILMLREIRHADNGNLQAVFEMHIEFGSCPFHSRALVVTLTALEESRLGAFETMVAQRLAEAIAESGADQ